MIAAPVLAEGIVRSRDGRSILDRDPGDTGPAKAFAADPDRLHTAVTVLEALGLTVDGVDTVAVVFRGTREAFTAAFGVQLDGTGPLWALAGGGAEFDVAPASRLGGVLHTVAFRTPTSPLVRKPAIRELFPAAGTPAEVLPRDLLLGEVAESLRVGLPTRFQAATSLPDTAVGVLTETRRTMQGWAADDLSRELRTYIASFPPKSAVHADIVELAAHDGIAAAFGHAAGAVVVPRLGLQPLHARTNLLRGDVDWAVGEEVQRVTALVLLSYDTLQVAINTASGHFAAVAESLPAEDRPSEELKAAWTPMHTALDALQELTTTVRTSRYSGTFDDFAPADATVLAALVAGMAAELASGTVDSVSERASTIGGHLGTLHDWMTEQQSWFFDVLERAEQVENRHATMVSLAFLAVAMDATQVTVHRVGDPGFRFWRAPVAIGDRRVRSASFGRCRPKGFTRTEVDALRTAALARPEVLHVVGVGNYARPGDPSPDAPSLDAVAAADLANVLVVGGCAPGPAGWVPNDETHGYRIGRPLLPVVTVPHICATTMNRDGGAVVFPDPADSSTTPDYRWWTGSGSSLSTPIVAAACALVWGACPQLTAAEVKDVVLAGAEQLGAGAFRHPDAAVVIGQGANQHDPNGVTHPGAKRLLLDGALRALALHAKARFPDPLLRLLVPAATSSSAS